MQSYSLEQIIRYGHLPLLIKLEGLRPFLKSLPKVFVVNFTLSSGPLTVLKPVRGDLQRQWSNRLLRGLV